MLTFFHSCDFHLSFPIIEPLIVTLEKRMFGTLNIGYSTKEAIGSFVLVKLLVMMLHVDTPDLHRVANLLNLGILSLTMLTGSKLTLY